MQVLGLTGFAGAGKSTVANYLVEEHGYTRLSFAAPLKKMLRTLDPILGVTKSRQPLSLGDSLAMYDNDETELKGSPLGDEYRRLLQVLGTDCIRAVDQDFWVKAAVAQMTDDNGKYVFDDVRFPNEAEVIKDLNPLSLWNIERAGYEAVNGHASEAHAGNMGESIFLFNAQTLGYIHEQVDYAVEMAFSDTAALA